MYRRIVVGYDGSDQARDALALAGVLRAPDGEVVAACVHGDPGFGRWPEWRDELARDALRRAEKAREQVGEPWLDCRAVAAHSPAAGLQALAEEEQADLLVVGSSHRGEIGRVLAGSLGEKLLNGSPCPVAVAPRGYRDEAAPARVIGVAYDGGDEAAAALAEAARLAVEASATVRLICAVQPGEWVWGGEALAYQQAHAEEIEAAKRESAREKLDAAADSLPADLRPATTLVSGRAAEAIVEEAGKGVQLLVMGSRAYGPLRRVLAGSTAVEVMRSAPCPVLVVPRGARTGRPETEAAAATTG